VPAVELDKIKRKSVKEGESVTLDTCIGKKENDVIQTEGKSDWISDHHKHQNHRLWAL
ncbi:hypothetical protein M9458_044443, partial [Cirrhinus mrigala]